MNIPAIIKQQGYQAIIPAIDKSIRDFKNMEYTRSEIKETLREFFFGHDDRIDQYIISKGY